MLDVRRLCLKLCLIKYELDVYDFENWLFSIVVSLQKAIAHFCCRKKIKEELEKYTFNHRKTKISLYLPHKCLDKKTVQVYHCESDIAILHSHIKLLLQSF